METQEIRNKEHARHKEREERREKEETKNKKKEKSHKRREARGKTGHEMITIGVEVERDPRGVVSLVARFQRPVVVSAWVLPLRGGSRRLTPDVRCL